MPTATEPSDSSTVPLGFCFFSCFFSCASAGPPAIKSRLAAATTVVTTRHILTLLELTVDLTTVGAYGSHEPGPPPHPSERVGKPQNLRKLAPRQEPSRALPAATDPESSATRRSRWATSSCRELKSSRKTASPILNRTVHWPCFV